MAGVDLLPHRLARLHPKFKTPYVSIIVFGIVAALLVLPGVIAGGKEIDLMSAVYSLAATFAFCSAHLSVMRLRFIEPALHRPYRMPWNVKFGRDSIPVLSLVGALFIGTVFTQLVFQNISNSTFIFMGWLLLGVLVYLLYRRYRHEPLWEPLEVPPIREREFEHVPFESQPRSARYRMGRRERITAHAARARHVHERHRVLIVLVFSAVSGFAVFIDLSGFDPFGPGLGWSPGLVVVAFLAAYVLNRSHAEQ